MKKEGFILGFLAALLQFPLWGQESLIYVEKDQVTIGFGSCGHQEAILPALGQAAGLELDAFVFLGDNIYGDSEDPAVLKEKYAQLASNPNFKRLTESTRIFATWDDHDFGQNDAGRHYVQKQASKELFMDFFGIPESSPRRSRSGIYTSYYLNAKGKTVQVLVLDLRTFRDNLKRYHAGDPKDEAFFYDLDYVPYGPDETDSTLLGKAQWVWLEEELQKPADVRIVASSTQFGISYNGYEAWANFPHERERLVKLISTTKAEGVLFISGDVHYAELSRIERRGCYPLYDLTSSGLSSTWGFSTPNENRIAGPVMENNFGVLTIDFQTKHPKITMEIKDAFGVRKIELEIPLEDLKF